MSLVRDIASTPYGAAQRRENRRRMGSTGLTSPVITSSSVAEVGGNGESGIVLSTAPVVRTVREQPIATTSSYHHQSSASLLGIASPAVSVPPTAQVHQCMNSMGSRLAKMLDCIESAAVKAGQLELLLDPLEPLSVTPNAVCDLGDQIRSLDAKYSEIEHRCDDALSRSAAAQPFSSSRVGEYANGASTALDSPAMQYNDLHRTAACGQPSSVASYRPSVIGHHTAVGVLASIDSQSQRVTTSERLAEHKPDPWGQNSNRISFGSPAANILCRQQNNHYRNALPIYPSTVAMPASINTITTTNVGSDDEELRMLEIALREKELQFMRLQLQSKRASKERSTAYQ